MLLPPLSLLTDEQALFYFKSGYTARIAGTEQGIKETTAVCSPGFAAPFLPLPIEIYVNLHINTLVVISHACGW